MQLYSHLDKKTHGTLDFPVEYYYVDCKHPRYRMSFHWHKEWELMRIIDGSFQIFIDDKQYNLSKGDIMLIPGEALHGGEPDNCIYECLDFDLYALFKKLDFAKSHLRPFYRKIYIPQMFFQKNEGCEFNIITNKLMNCFNGNCTELDALCYIGNIFSYIIKSGNYSTAKDDSDSRWAYKIKPVLEYIDTHFSETISLEDLAKIAGMNPKYFCRVFYSLTHYTPMNYVNFYRIEQAAYMLDTTDLSVTAIGMECGFWESSHFTKVFRKHKGTTPKKYRQNLLKKH